MQNNYRRFMVIFILILMSITMLLPEFVVSADGGEIYFPVFLKGADVYHAFGLDGGTVEGIVIDPMDSDTLYANSWGAGVYKSTDGGRTWENESEGLESGFVYELAIDPSDSDHILSSDYEHGIKQTFNGGETWTAVSGIPEGSVIYSIDFNPSKPYIVYAAIRELTIYENGVAVAWPGDVFKSTNGGTTWVRKSNGLPGDYVYDLAIDPNNTGTVYTAMHRTGVYKTEDGGGSWEAMNDTIIDGDVRSVYVTPDSSRVYIGFWDGYGMSYSEDGGETWVSVAWTNANNLNVWEVQVDPNRPNNVYLSTSSGIYKCKAPSADSTCTVFAHDGKFTFDLTFDVNGPKDKTGNTEVMYTGLQTHAIFKSTSSGSDFLPSYKNIRANIINAILIDPTNTNIQYVSSLGRGLFRTENGGTTWITLEDVFPFEYVNDLAFRPLEYNVIYAGTMSSGVQVSLDYARSWFSVNSGLSRAEIADIILVEEPSPEELYSWMDPVDLEDMLVAQGSESSNRSPSTYNVTAFGFHYDSAQSQNMFIGTDGGGVLFSTNSGSSWTASDLTSGTVTDALANPDASVYKYVISLSDGGVMKSADTNAWTSLSTGLPTKVNAIANIPGTTTYFAATDSGVYWTPNTSTPWTLIAESGVNVSDLLVDPNDATRIWATTKYGLYCSTDSGSSWSYYDLPEIPNTELLTIVAVPGATSLLIGTNGGDYYEFTP